MNIYGHTNCPKCGSRNSKFRPDSDFEITPVAQSAWDEVECWNCNNQYRHLDIKDGPNSHTDHNYKED